MTTANNNCDCHISMPKDFYLISKMFLHYEFEKLILIAEEISQSVYNYKQIYPTHIIFQLTSTIKLYL